MMVRTHQKKYSMTKKGGREIISTGGGLKAWKSQK